MRVLIVNVNQEHVNSMHKECIQSFSNTMQTDYYGPGHSSERELHLGINKYVEAHGPYNAIIVTTPFFLSCSHLEPIREIYSMHRYLLSKYTITQGVRYCSSIMKDLCKIRDITKAVFYSYDFINLSNRRYRHLKSFLEDGFYIIGPGKDFISYTQELNGEQAVGMIPTNYYYDLVTKYYGQWISLPIWSAASNEYDFGNLTDRKYDWAVPGCHYGSFYPERSKIFKALSSSGYKIWDKDIDSNMAYKDNRKCRWKYCEYNNKRDRILNSILRQSNCYIPNHVKYEEIARFRENYQECLRNSKCAYADGGVGHTVVRKYMEIPAKGTVLLGEMVVGLDKLGFIPGENMIAVSSSNIIDESKELFADMDRMQQIAANGRNLVIKKHTFQHRASAVAKALESICKNEFAGSYWENGNFIIDKTNRQ